MTWIDLGAVTIVLWSAVKGYISGARQACMHLCGFIAALLIACLLHNPFSVYLHNEWQTQAVFVGWFSRNVDTLLKTGTTGSLVLPVPPLASTMVKFLSTDVATVPVLNQDMALAALAEIMVRISSLASILLIMAGIVSLMLRIKYLNLLKKNYPEWKRTLGLVFGIAHGLMLSLVLCVVLDALSLVMLSGFMSFDLHESYLFQLSMYLVRFL